MENTPHVPGTHGGDENQSHLFAAIGYLPPLFFVPLFLGKKDEFAVWHGKQGLVVTVLAVAGGILSPFVAGLIPVIGTFAVFIFNVCVLILVLGGAWNAYKGKKWELPLVGKFARDIKL